MSGTKLLINLFPIKKTRVNTMLKQPIQKDMGLSLLKSASRSLANFLFVCKMESLVSTLFLRLSHALMHPKLSLWPLTPWPYQYASVYHPASNMTICWKKQRPLSRSLWSLTLLNNNMQLIGHKTRVTFIQTGKECPSLQSPC